ncbi:GNAT family N-acetyltransferase [Mesorhizobium sp. LHD-90]|uniref:GNAT family N-acetyltransferase n=1 Tax=Mesorhizobium sp. LHD-90 TaxID=3071414 RepID=UPI0027DFD2A9|nr:GNAT family N-acetyltransferase [Mesorhizobium sp. LHD-90]MDQ6436173.1 GNAT family N-acetyltransferase [Mesorhizobium sp. LHD-90]
MTVLIRTATRNDALHVAAIVDIAGHGIDLGSWLRDLDADHAVLSVARRAASADSNSAYHFSRAHLIELDGEVAGGLVGSLLTGDENEVLDPGSPIQPLVTLETRLPGYWSILAIAVYPEFRGKGLAQELLAHATGLAVTCGAKGLSLVVEDTNASAIALYGRMGYAMAETLPWIAYSGRSGPKNWMMMKKGLGPERSTS